MIGAFLEIQQLLIIGSQGAAPYIEGMARDRENWATDFNRPAMIADLSAFDGRWNLCNNIIESLLRTAISHRNRAVTGPVCRWTLPWRLNPGARRGLLLAIPAMKIY
jgi:hypothetical protein